LSAGVEQWRTLTDQVTHTGADLVLRRFLVLLEIEAALFEVEGAVRVGLRLPLGCGLKRHLEHHLLGLLLVLLIRGKLLLSPLLKPEHALIDAVDR